MKKLLLLLVVMVSCHMSFGQYRIFMSIIENKIICNNDRFINYLESSSFVRNSNTFHNEYNGTEEPFYTTITYNNDCYAVYSTNSGAEYNKIKNKITEIGTKAYSADGSLYYNCNVKNIHHVQVFFLGYFSSTKTYEIKIYQNPSWED